MGKQTDCKFLLLRQFKSSVKTIRISHSSPTYPYKYRQNKQEVNGTLREPQSLHNKPINSFYHGEIIRSCYLYFNLNFPQLENNYKAVNHQNIFSYRHTHISPYLTSEKKSLKEGFILQECSKRQQNNGQSTLMKENLKYLCFR